MSTRPLEPWEPDPRWHPARREAFEAYRDMGAERSLRVLARRLAKSRTLVSRWSMEDGWPERAGAWDAEADRVRREEFLGRGAEVAADQAEAAAALREALLEPARAALAKLAEAKRRGEDPFRGMTAAQLLRLVATCGRALERAVIVERLALGMSTENLAGHDGGDLVPPDIARKDTAELEAYLLGRADERGDRERAEA
jgi:hypothetical protein